MLCEYTHIFKQLKGYDDNMRIASIVDNDSINSLTGFTTSIYFQGCLSTIAKIVTANRLGI